MKKLSTICARFVVVLLLAVYGAGLCAPVASALAPDQKQIIDSNIRHFLIRQPKAACTAAGGGGSSATIDPADENIKSAFLYFVQRGLTAEQSAGIVGNLIAESGVEPRIIQGGELSDTMPRNIFGTAGYGIAQWTSEGRQRNFIAYAAAHASEAPDPAKAESNLKIQLDFLYDEELSKAYADSLAKIKAASTVRASSDIILHEFEQPRDQSTAVEETRAGAGQQVYDLYKADAAGIGGGTGTGTGTGATAGGSCGAGGGGTAGVGFVGFPLQTTKLSMTENNNGCITEPPAMCQGGHPYAAYDIMAETDTPVLSLFDGVVVDIGEDKCPGRLVSVYSAAQGVTLSYLHMSMSQTKVTDGQAVTAGQVIGIVGAAAEGCGVAHLHLDAAEGDRRPGCRREDCPVANQAIFTAGEAKIKLGESLYQNYLKLP